jgi:hypothetical protein
MMAKVVDIESRVLDEDNPGCKNSESWLKKFDKELAQEKKTGSSPEGSNRQMKIGNLQEVPNRQIRWQKRKKGRRQEIHREFEDQGRSKCRKIGK